MIDTPWWSFNPHLAEYVSLGSPVAVRHEGGRREMYVWRGGSLWYRVYNAILQGSSARARSRSHALNSTL